MIKSKDELRDYLREDKLVFEQYVKENFKSLLFLKITNDHVVKCYKYVVLYRKTQYYKYVSEKRKTALLQYVYYTFRKNCLGNKLGFYIPATADIGPGLIIYHHGNIIINGNVTIGRGCKLHGSNCIGNGGTNQKTPCIGDNVDFGFGSSVVGGVKIANGTVIGAGAVVVKDQNMENATIMGIPAKAKEMDKVRE